MESWVDTANEDTCFPLQNLPYGVFRPTDGPARCGVAIGDRVLDLAALEDEGLIDVGPSPVFNSDALNGFMALGRPAWDRVRGRLVDLLSVDGAADLRDESGRRARCFHAADEVELLMPVRIRGYTDFNAARQHAFNAGSLLRGPENALPPNWLHMPIAYNGRASTIVVSGTPIRRPCGQIRPPDADRPIFAPSRRLDFELEFGALIGTPTSLGQRVDVATAETMIFGYVLLNDWSARDIQRWESHPLGPFQGKAFATTISPWVVPAAALDPARVSAPTREQPLLPYLEEPHEMHLDVGLEAAIVPAGAGEAAVVTRTNTRHLYYSIPQMIAHHAACGCAMECGDLIGTGTVSGPEPGAWASLLELSRGGSETVSVGGEVRTFLEDGDEVRITGRAPVDGATIGFGPCNGVILPAHPVE